MDLDEDSRLQPRQNVQENDRHIGIHEYSMGAIHKENISAFQLVKNVELHILQRTSDDGVAQAVDSRPRLRIDRRNCGW